ncbi:MAG: helix-turn-helix transcriptional regulator [Oscillospiraceae bacterium]|nr:helix-turn-helix transcriptional regulator [Oscillospiraceae bacterium]
MKTVSGVASAELLYAREDVYENNWFSSVHSHSYTELFYITLGEGIFSIAGNRISVKSGDLLLINSNVPHTELSSKQNALGYIVLGVKSVEFVFENEENRDYLMSCNPILTQKLAPIFREILQEKESGERYSSELCQSLLQTVLFYILKNTGDSISLTESERSVSKECAEVKRYIDSHFKEDITLDVLSRRAHINKYYLVHSFKKAFGMSPINYLQFRRITESRRIIVETDTPISQIAQMMGFTSQSSFTQCFKRIVNLTPTHLRKTSKSLDSIKE